ncbi:type IV secretory system conjugative DNA transfer family protein [Vibrio anguillarum]|uniref:type IV secretory system conjugative DNA transfer family protein n=3 Tax=Vibrio anguillarum TaxID=55601 RepID=UPI000BB4E9BF|nr:type IV secretory system conjugative DNA transfer family protein [Vibrio anguillarum]ATC60186.1 hypothetical protein CMV05_22615 [Vibrio anguillarum]MBF4250654.1 hypothetical protein [Vibrio anguillarum]MBF4342098.1 hypothetical protein [Vibrio anguillarum]
MIVKPKIWTLIVALCAGLSSTVASSAENLNIYEYFKGLRRDSNLTTGESNGWLTDTTSVQGLIARGMDMEAQSVGVQAGTLYAENEIKSILDASAKYLDQTFDISPYLSTYKHYLIMPAIITEVSGRKTYLNSKKTAFTYAGVSYLIQAQPYFIDSPPTWRQYVRFHSKPPHIVSKSLLPKTSEEIRRWEKAYDEGWAIGINNTINNTNYQLTRALYDLQGVQLYIMLRDAGLVSKPIIKENHMPVSGTRKKLELDGGMVQITVEPQMVSDATQWRSIPKLPPLDNLLPRSMYDMINRVGK